MSPLCSSHSVLHSCSYAPLTQFAAVCTDVPQLQQTLMSPLPTLSLALFLPFLPSGLEPLCHSSTIRSFYAFAALEVLQYTPTGTLSSAPSTCGSCSLVHCLHCKFRCFFHTLLRLFPRHLLLLPCRSPLVRSCQFSSPWMLNVS